MSLGGGGGTPPPLPEYKPPPLMAPETKMEEEAVTDATNAERRRMAGLFARQGTATSRGLFSSGGARQALSAGLLSNRLGG